MVVGPGVVVGAGVVGAAVVVGPFVVGGAVVVALVALRYEAAPFASAVRVHSVLA